MSKFPTNASINTKSPAAHDLDIALGLRYLPEVTDDGPFLQARSKRNKQKVYIPFEASFFLLDHAFLQSRLRNKGEKLKPTCPRNEMYVMLDSIKLPLLTLLCSCKFSNMIAFRKLKAIQSNIV